MKKSNIVLISIFTLLLITTVIMQLKVKSYLKTVELNEIDISLLPFNKIEVGHGWYIEMYNDTVTKVTISADSIKNFISMDQNKLILNACSTDSKNRVIAKVYNPDIKQIKLSGNSRLYYYIDSIDSLNLKLHDNSSCVLTNVKDANQIEDVKKEKGQIDILTICASNESQLRVSCNLEEIQGELNDSSYCHIPGEVLIKNFKKSKDANINSW